MQIKLNYFVNIPALLINTLTIISHKPIFVNFKNNLNLNLKNELFKARAY